MKYIYDYLDMDQALDTCRRIGSSACSLFLFFSWVLSVFARESTDSRNKRVVDLSTLLMVMYQTKNSGHSCTSPPCMVAWKPLGIPKGKTPITLQKYKDKYTSTLDIYIYQRK